MKKSLFIILFLITGCGVSDLYNMVGYRRFKVGDCLIASLDAPEKWELSKPKYVVLELGTKNYLALDLELYRMNIYHTINIKYGHLWEGFYQKVECSK